MGKNKRKSIERVILNAFSCLLHKTILLIVICSNRFWAMIYLICDFEIIPKGIFDMIYMFLADGFEEARRSAHLIYSDAQDLRSLPWVLAARIPS